MQYYNIAEAELVSFSDQLAKDGTASDHTSVTQAMKHFVRDWSEDGIEEREAVFPQILETLEGLFPGRWGDENEVKVLVPGSGLGRMAHEVDGLGGEFSGGKTKK